MNLARFAHSYANLRAVNLAGLRARVKVPPMLNAAARGPSRSSRRYQQQEGWRPSRHPIIHANSKRPLAANPSDSYRCSCSSLLPGGIRTRAPRYRKRFSGVNRLKVPGVRPLFELATQLVKILYGLV